MNSLPKCRDVSTQVLGKNLVMLIGVNATRRSLAVAFFTILQAYAAVAAWDATSFSLNAVTQSKQTLSNCSSETEGDNDLPLRSDHGPFLVSNHRINEFPSLKRRGLRTGQSIAGANWSTELVTYLTPVFKISMQPQRSDCDPSLARDLEYLRAPTHETRGKPYRRSYCS